MNKTLKALDSFEGIVATILFFIMCLAVIFQIISRIILGNPSLYTEEIARFSYVWVVFLCMSLAEKNLEHFSVEVFLGFLKGKADIAVRVFENLIGLATFIFLSYWSFKFFSFQRIIKSPAMEISMSVIAASMVVGFVLCSVRRATHLFKNIRRLFDSDSVFKEVK